MAPNKPHRKGDDIVIHMMEAVVDEHVIQLQHKVFYPQLLLGKFNEMNTHIDGLTARLSSKD